MDKVLLLSYKLLVFFFLSEKNKERKRSSFFQIPKFSKKNQVYVSDRRFMKAVNLLQVAAHADNRTSVGEYDCLLLEHVFGQR